MHAYKIEHISQSDELQHDSDFKKIGLPYEAFLKAVDAGYRAYRREDDENSTKSSPGHNAWSYVVKYLRREAIKYHWGKSFYSNGFEGINNSLKGITIIVNSGDKNTGIEREVPRSKNQKGSGYGDLMNGNLDLFYNYDNLFEANAITKDPTDSNQTWLLLFYIDEKNEEVRFELLLPTEIKNKNFAGYKKRIILSPIDISNKPKPTQKESSEDLVQEVNFDVPRKRG